MPPDPPAEPRFGAALRRADPLAWAGVGGAFVLVAYPVYWALTVLRPLFGGSRGHAGDFMIYYDAGRRVLTDPATLYATDNFIYPPPSGAVFAVAALLPLEPMYVAVAALNLALLAVCVRLGERIHPDPPRGWARAALWTTALGVSPALQNVKFGQVGPLILLVSMLFLLWVERAPARAGAVLAVGFWIKLYPAVLGVFALRRGSWPAVGGAVAMGLAIPLVLLPLFPPDLYLEYLRDVLPTVRDQTVPTVLNGGLPATIQRIGLPASTLLQYSPEPMTPLAEWAGRLALLGGVGAAVVAWRRGWPTAWAGLAALAAVPVASSFAWEYTFLLALPLTMAALLVARRGGPGVRVAAALAALTLFVMKPPEYAVAWLIERVPGWTLDLFSARFLIALAVLGACALWVRYQAERREPSVPLGVV